MATYMSIQNVPACGANAVSRLHNDIDRLFGGFFRTPLLSGFCDDFQTSALLPPVDLTSDDKGYTFTVELPGVNPDDVRVQLEKGVLTLSGEKKEEVADKETKHVRERRYGAFTRSFTLPDDADADALKAVAKNGVLTLELSRRAEAPDRARTIEVQAG